LVFSGCVPQQASVPFGAGPDPQILGQPEQYTARYGCLVSVITAVFDLQHHIRAEQGAEVQRVAVAEEPPGRAQAQRPDPDPT
jgi:hypothetical protein